MLWLSRMLRMAFLLFLNMTALTAGIAVSEHSQNLSITKDRKMFDKAGNLRSIPFLLHFINIEDRPLLKIEEARIKSWKDRHPGWQCKIWTKTDLANIDLYTKELISQISSPQLRLELIRFELLYRFGGICIDLNMECLKSFKNLVTNCDFFAATTLENSALLKTSLLGAKKGHPAIRSFLEKVAGLSSKEIEGQDIKVLGNFLFTESFKQVEKKGNKDVIFDAHYFYPVPMEEQQKIIPLKTLSEKYKRPDCQAIQLCHSIPEIVVVVPSYNNGERNQNSCIKNLESLEKQNWPYFFAVIVDDCSKDNNFALISDYVKKHHLENKVKIIQNAERAGALANLYKTIHTLEDHKIVATLDGDDWFNNEHALTTIASLYADKQAWLTYGSYEFDYGGRQKEIVPVSEELCEKRIFRDMCEGKKWPFSQLRTFYAKLFNLIEKKDLVTKDGSFYPTTWDLAMMFPMLEMASKGHIRYNPDVVYIYNTHNPINDFRVNGNLQLGLRAEIIKKPMYKAAELW